MFEVIIRRKDQKTEIYDFLTEHQAQYVFFRERMNADTICIELNQFFD